VRKCESEKVYKVYKVVGDWAIWLFDDLTIWLFGYLVIRLFGIIVYCLFWLLWPLFPFPQKGKSRSLIMNFELRIKNFCVPKRRQNFN